jgi:aminopeptidase N
VKRIFTYLFFVPMLLQAQQHGSCPLDHYTDEVYENPLNDQWLSKYDVTFYHLSLEVSNMDTYLEGFTSIHLVVAETIDSLLFQLNSELQINAIEVNSVPAGDWRHADDQLVVPAVASAGDHLAVKIFYQGDASQDRGFFAGITSAYDNTNNQWVTYTLSEPLNARDWFPVKQVLNDKADSVWVDLTVDKELMAGSNGVLEEIEDIGGGKHTFKWRSRYPIAYYLISLAVADYRDYSFQASLSAPGDSVLVQNYIYDDDEYFSRWKSRIDDTGDMISLFSNLVIDYPFAREKYGHAVAPMGGGMEHQTMTTLAGFSFGLVAHELAHQWFGDNITCGNWQDIWINEGFASYFEYVALQYLVSQEEADKWMANARSVSFGETGSVYVPESEAENVNRVFDYGLSYKKGAALIHMIRYELNNDALFFDILRTYSERYTDSLATAVQFREVLEEISGMDFSCFFDQWYYGTGYPSFNLVAEEKNDTLYVQSLQETSTAGTPLFRMHFDLLISTSEGSDTVRLYQQMNEQVFAIPVSGSVYDIRFDPEYFLLAKSYAEVKIPDGKDYAIGPNPVQDRLLLRFRNLMGGEEVRIWDLQGKLVRDAIISSNPYELSFAGLPDGAYVMVLNGPFGQVKETIIKIEQP